MSPLLDSEASFSMSAFGNDDFHICPVWFGIIAFLVLNKPKYISKLFSFYRIRTVLGLGDLKKPQKTSTLYCLPGRPHNSMVEMLLQGVSVVYTYKQLLIAWNVHGPTFFWQIQVQWHNKYMQADKFNWMSRLQLLLLSISIFYSTYEKKVAGNL